MTPCKKTRERALPNVILGGRFGETSQRDSFRILDAFRAGGGTAIDTARCYADGRSESCIRRWLTSRRARDDVFIITKGCHPKDDGRPRVTPEAIREDLAESLRTLNLEQIDLYLLHRDDESVAIGPLLETLLEKSDSGRIAAFGASNWSTARITAALEFAKAGQLEGFVASSSQFSLAVPREPAWPGSRWIDRDAWRWHRDAQFPLLAWSAQARGWFAGRAGEIARDPKLSRVYDWGPNRARLSRAHELASRRGVSPAEVALAYTLNQPFPVSAIVGPETVAEVELALAASRIELTAEELDYLHGSELDGSVCG